MSELTKSLPYHSENIQEITYLHKYRKGIQPILERTKTIRPEICNKIVDNIADQAVIFHNGYFMNEPAFYVSRKEGKDVRDLNEYLYLSGKHDADNDVIDSFHTCGIGILYVEPSTDGAKAYSLDPREAYVVYSTAPGNEPMYAVNIAIINDETYYDVFTKDTVFRLKGGKITSVSTDNYIYGTPLNVESVMSNIIGEIPIIEYTYNRNRMGVFESAISLMDANNLAESNRLDGIEQFIQNLMVLYNCDLEEGTTANTIKEAGLIKLRSTTDVKADVKIISECLDQAQTQTTLDDLYEKILNACAMPSVQRNEGSSSDNGSAVYMKSGYSVVDTVTRDTTDLFLKSNRRFDKVFLAILKNKVHIKPDDFELHIEHNTVSNLLVKTQAAINMKQLGFSPELAFKKSGLSNDPIKDVEESREYIDKMWNTPQVTPQVEGEDKGEVIGKDQLEEVEDVQND